MKCKGCKTISEEKKDSIIHAASDLFLCRGYGSVSMDEIASEANVSKRTVYNHFPAKDVLFAEVVRLTWKDLPHPEVPDGEGHTVRQALTDYCLELVNLLHSEKFIKLLRLVMGESGRFPELKKMYSESGIRPTIETLSEYLRAQTAEGKLKTDDPLLASKQLIGMVKESLFWPVQLGIAPEPTEEEERRIVNSSIDLFLKNYS